MFPEQNFPPRAKRGNIEGNIMLFVCVRVGRGKLESITRFHKTNYPKTRQPTKGYRCCFVIYLLFAIMNCGRTGEVYKIALHVQLMGKETLHTIQDVMFREEEISFHL